MAYTLADGMTKVTWCTTIASTAAPTATELNAGTDLQTYVVPDGLDVNTEETRIDVGNLGSRQDEEVAGRRKENLSLTMNNLGMGSAPFSTFAAYPSGYIVIRYGVLSTTAYAADDVVDVYTVTAGTRQRIKPAANDTLKFKVDFYSSAAMADAVDVVAGA